MSKRHWFLTAALVLLWTAPVQAQPYPRVASYARLLGGGFPLIQVVGGPIDSLLTKKMAQNGTITLDINPTWPLRPDIILSVKHYNAHCKVLAYHLTAWWYLDPTFVPSPTDQTFPALWHRAIQATGGFGAANSGGWLVNWNNRPTADTLTALLCRVAGSGIFDGMFLDYATSTWTDSVRVNAYKRLVANLKTAGGPTFTVVANGAQWDPSNTGSDGAMRENYTLPSIGLDSIRVWLQTYPRTDNWVKTEWSSGVWAYHAENCRRSRVATATACLFSSWSTFGSNRDIVGPPYYHGWWFDEYSVNSAGVADTLGNRVGWLGDPVGPARKVGFVWVREFTNGLVALNPIVGQKFVVFPCTGLYKRIQGVRDLVTNNGAGGASFSINADDGLFLVKIVVP